MKNLVYEGKIYWVLKVVGGYEVYKKGVTHSVRVSQIGFKDTKGRERAIRDCKNREALETALIIRKKKVILIRRE